MGENDYYYQTLSCQVESESHHAQGTSNVDVVKILLVYDQAVISAIDGNVATNLESDELTMEVTTSPTGVHKTLGSDVTTSYNMAGLLVCNSAPCPL
jgi:3-hydroxyisobutyrate dehydrogenase-like beta-hydroxyacid dehydrogenase